MLGKCCSIRQRLGNAGSVTVHRTDCPYVADINEKARLLRVDWGSDNRRYAVPVRLHASYRVGLLRDIARVLSAAGITIV